MNEFLNLSRQFTRQSVRFGLAATLTAGLIGFAPLANAMSTSTVRHAQEQLQTDGFYSGKIDGIDGPMTRSAIRQFQKTNNLRVTGRLDQQTRSDLMNGNSASSSQRNENNPNNPQKNWSNANSPQTNGYNAPNSQANANNQNSSNTVSNSKANIQSAQQLLQGQGLYKGPVNGVMNSQTQTALRHYQQNNNLNVTGRLDSKTLSSLGITNQGSVSQK
jgi:peptidoglycan hydrolase-like protein with peptidoglycan-binding domain